MKEERYRVVRLGSRKNRYYCRDVVTGSRTSLKTTDRETADRIVLHRNEVAKNPHINRQIGMAYLSGADPNLVLRVWQDVMDDILRDKQGSTLDRYTTAMNDSAFDRIREQVVVTTQPEDLKIVLRVGTVSTNVYLRRLHNYALDMGWLTSRILPTKLWGKIKYKKKRAIKHEEHKRIIEREKNLERKAFYDLCWELGGSQGDIANLEAEDADWTDHTICYNRKKLAHLDETDVKPPLIRIGKRCAAILKSLPQTGPLFPNLRKVKSKDRANEFRQRCQGLGIKGVTLHSYRYSWAERARKANYPRREAEEALGHNCHAVHIAYASRAQVTVAPLEDYEEMAAKKDARVGLAGEPNCDLPVARS